MSAPNDCNQSLRGAAESYARRGWMVFPLHGVTENGTCTCGRPDCTSPGKHPRTRHGLQDASLDVEVIARWWAQFPDANVGIRTGAASGIVVVDIDPRHGGDVSLAALLEGHGFYGTTPTVATGGGGMHLYFAAPEQSIGNKVGFRPGVDLRGDGGYVVAPPSRHASGQPYSWTVLPDEAEPASLPVWANRPASAVHPYLPAVLHSKEDPICEGQRNATLASIAGRLRRAGAGEKAILVQLHEENAARCSPPLGEDELASIARSMMRYEPAPPAAGGDDGDDGDDRPVDLVGKTPFLRTLIPIPPSDNFLGEGIDLTKLKPHVRLVIYAGPLPLSCDQAEVAYAIVIRRHRHPRPGIHHECLPVASPQFSRWLINRFFDFEQVAPPDKAVQQAVDTICARARAEGIATEVHTRVASMGTTVFLDLADPRWRMVCINDEGWKVSNFAAAFFCRRTGMRALPEPLPGGSIHDLRPFVNVESEEDFMLLVGWLLGALSGVGPFPILVLQGEQGSAKSTTARVLQALVDPHAAGLRSEPRDIRDLMISAGNAWVLAFDNISSIQQAISDAFCGLATGLGQGNRQLYTDSDEIIFNRKRPLLLNGITEFVTRSDLLDRAIMVTLPPIQPSQRRPEKDFWEEFENARPRILGALLDAISTALRRRADIHLPTLPRMADFAVFVEAAAERLGWPPLAFLDAYERNRKEGRHLAIESAPVLPHIEAIVRSRGGYWEGTPTALLNELNESVPEHLRPRTGWPRTAAGLSGLLSRQAPNLRAAGRMDVRRSRSKDARVIQIKLLDPGTRSAEQAPEEGLDF